MSDCRIHLVRVVEVNLKHQRMSTLTAPQVVDGAGVV